MGREIRTALENPVRADILRVFRANPLLRDGAEVIASRIGRVAADVQKALDDLEAQGLVARRWVGGTPLYFFTGAPDTGLTPAAEALARGDERAPALAARLSVPSTLDGVGLARSAIEGLCRACQMQTAMAAEFTIALSEALTNAYRYGRRGDGRDTIRATFRLVGDAVEVGIQDRGSGFPSLLVGVSHGDVQSTGGRGLMLMRSLTDNVEIRRTPAGTLVMLTKRLSPPAPTAAQPTPLAPATVAPGTEKP